jgi:hypothetical protein
MVAHNIKIWYDTPMMEEAMEKNTHVKDRKLDYFAVPMSVEETKHVHSYLSATGLKKGYFARQAILKYLEEQENALAGDEGSIA